MTQCKDSHAKVAYIDASIFNSITLGWYRITFPGWPFSGFGVTGFSAVVVSRCRCFLPFFSERAPILMGFCIITIVIILLHHRHHRKWSSVRERGLKPQTYTIPTQTSIGCFWSHKMSAVEYAINLSCSQISQTMQEEKKNPDIFKEQEEKTFSNLTFSPKKGILFFEEEVRNNHTSTNRVLEFFVYVDIASLGIAFFSVCLVLYRQAPSLLLSILWQSANGSSIQSTHSFPLGPLGQS